MRSTPIVLVLAFAMAGCVATDADQGLDPAGDASYSESEPVAHPVSIDLVVPFYVFYSVVAWNHCDSELVKLDGPITSIDVTARWDASDPLVPKALEMSVYNGTEGREWEWDDQPIAAKKGTSPLTLDADVTADDTVRLRICQRDNLAVAHDFDVHIEGTIHQLPQTPAAT